MVANDWIRPSTSILFRAPPGRAGHLFTLASCLRELRPDLLLTYGWGGVDAIAAGRLAGLRRIVHMEDGFLPDEAIKQKFKRLMARCILLRAASWLVCPSQTLVMIAQKQWWLPERDVRFIPNGVDTEFFARIRQTLLDNDLAYHRIVSSSAQWGIFVRRRTRNDCCGLLPN